MTKFLRISTHHGTPKSSTDKIPIIFDSDQKRFMCCDSSHILHHTLSESEIFPVNKKHEPKNPEKLQHLTHRHGRTLFKLDVSALSEDYILENGGFLVIFDSKSTRPFKKIKHMISYLSKKGWISEASVNTVRKYSFLRDNLLLEDEEWADEVSSKNSSVKIILKNKNEKNLLKKPPTFFDNEKFNPKLSNSKIQSANLAHRRLKDARYFMRVANFKYQDLEKQLKQKNLEIANFKAQLERKK